MGNRGHKTMNEYALLLGDVYARIPKAVLAAIAASFCGAGAGEFDRVRARVLAEWVTLHANGIVPQAPPKVQT